MEGIKNNPAKCKTNEKEPSVMWPFWWSAFKKGTSHKPKAWWQQAQSSLTSLCFPIVYLLALAINRGILALLPDSWEILARFQYPHAVGGVKVPTRGQLPWQSLLTLKGIPSASQTEPRDFCRSRVKSSCHKKITPAQPGIFSIGSALSVGRRKYARWNFNIYSLQSTFKSCCSTASRPNS